MNYLIVIAGKMRTGKNTFAEIFKEECFTRDYTVRIDSYASVLKKWCAEEFKTLTDYLNGFSHEVKANIPMFAESRFDSLKESIDKVIDKVHTKKENWFEDKNDITRLILQIVGTNLIRKHVDDDFWVKELLKKLKNYKEKFVLVTDARFANEIDAPCKLVEDRRVISVKMERDTIDKSQHLSETALDNYPWFNYTIDNSGSLRTLSEAVRTVINDIEEQEKDL